MRDSSGGKKRPIEEVQGQRSRKAKLEPVSRDSTGHKKVEDRLRFYAAIMANMSEGVYAIRASDGVIVHNNPKFEQMFCYGPGELAGKHVSIVNAPTEKSPQETAEQIIEVLNQEGTWRGEILNIKKDGTPFWCYASVSTFEHPEHGKVWVTMHTDITERKKAEEELRGALEKLRDFRDIVNRSTALVFIWRVVPGEWPVEFVSDNVRRILGYTSDDFISGRVSWPGITHPDDVPRLEAEVAQYSKEGKKEWSQEYRLITKSGEVRWFRDQNLALADSNGNITRIQSIVLDVTERKKAEEKLQNNEEIFRQVVENVSEVFFLSDASDDSAIYVSPAYKEIFGRPVETLYVNARSWQEAVHPEDREHVDAVLEKHGRGRKEFSNEYRIVRPDGSIRWVHDHVYPVRNESGDIYRIVGFTEDITERKKVEDRLCFYAAIMANMSEGVYAIRGADGVIVHNNLKFEQMFGYAPGELAGKHVSIVNAPTEKSPQETAEQIIEVLNQEGTWRGEILNIKKDGTPFWCYASVSTFEHPEHGKVWVTMHTDITEHRQAEQHIARLAKFPAENPNPVLRISKDCRILYANKASSVVLETWAINVGQRLPEACCKRVKEALSSGKVSTFEFECHDGRTFEVTLAPVIELGYVNAYGLDITGRKKAEEKLIEDWEKLKFLASQLTLVEERERRRIAAELHDRISQSLVISKIRLDGLRHSVSPEDPVKVMEEVCGSLGQAIADIRSLTFDLSSPILHELGFEAAVEALLVDQIEQKHGIATEFDDDGQAKPLDDDIQAILFRNVRELLVNVVKHANANKVKASIRKIGSQISVSIEDDGIGFDPAKVASRSVREGGFGLFSIRERLEQLGGHLEIESGPKRGTKVTMLAPLKEGDIRNERK